MAKAADDDIDRDQLGVDERTTEHIVLVSACHELRNHEVVELEAEDAGRAIRGPILHEPTFPACR